MISVIRFKKLLSLAAAFGLVQTALIILSDTAFATVTPATAMGTCGSGTVGGVVACVIQNTQDSKGIFPALSYLFGLVIGLWAIAKFYEHVQNPHQVSVWEGIKRTLCAGCLFALPMVAEAAYNTLNGGGFSTLFTTGWNGTTTGAGLDAMVVALMSDAYKPMWNMLMLFCYLAGFVLIIIGILRLLKSAQEGPRGPGGFGTIMTFIVAGALLSMNEMMGNWLNTLFGNSITNNYAQLSFSAGLTALEEQHVLSVISAILAFVMVLGWISFIRGWFIIRDVAEGNQQASLMAALTHIFGGALAINLGGLLNVVQETFGLGAIGVNFM